MLTPSIDSASTIVSLSPSARVVSLSPSAWELTSTVAPSPASVDLSGSSSNSASASSSSPPTSTPGSMAPAPKGVKGTMDGEKPPMTQVDDLRVALEPYQKKYGHYLSKIQPWMQFCKLSKPKGDIRQRLESNLVVYQINYAVIFLLLMVTSIVMNPKCLIVICVLILVWCAFLRKNDDPNWEVAIAGMPVGKTQRWMALSGITAIVMLCVVGNVLSSAAFFCAMIVLAHAMLHPVTTLDSEVNAVAGEEML